MPFHISLGVYLSDRVDDLADKLSKVIPGPHQPRCRLLNPTTHKLTEEARVLGELIGRRPTVSEINFLSARKDFHARARHGKLTYQEWLNESSLMHRAAHKAAWAAGRDPYEYARERTEYRAAHPAPYLDESRITGKRETAEPRYGNAEIGYGNKIPTRYEIQIDGRRWHRIYVINWSNSGSAYIVLNGQDTFLGSYNPRS